MARIENSAPSWIQWISVLCHDEQASMQFHVVRLEEGPASSIWSQGTTQIRGCERNMQAGKARHSYSWSLEVTITS